MSRFAEQTKRLFWYRRQYSAGSGPLALQLIVAWLSVIDVSVMLTGLGCGASLETGVSTLDESQAVRARVRKRGSRGLGMT